MTRTDTLDDPEFAKVRDEALKTRTENMRAIRGAFALEVQAIDDKYNADVQQFRDARDVAIRNADDVYRENSYQQDRAYVMAVEGFLERREASKGCGGGKGCA